MDFSTELAWIHSSRLEIVFNLMPEEHFLISGFSGSRYEKFYLEQQLMPFHADGWIERVLFTIKRGKEAAVYCCQANPHTGYDYIAAKVYHARRLRAMQNYSVYQEGRGMFSADGGTHLSERERRALAKNTGFGKSLGTNSWTTHEFATLLRLEELEIPSPQALDMGPSVILMEYFGDESRGAPTLIGVAIDTSLARKLYVQCLTSIERMLEDFIIHGDLSAYNILLWEDESIIIDVPQVVDPMSNPNARWIFDRDVKRVCEYFTKCGIETDWQTTAGDLWIRYVESGDSHSYFFGDPIAGVTSPSAPSA